MGVQQYKDGKWTPDRRRPQRQGASIARSSAADGSAPGPIGRCEHGASRCAGAPSPCAPSSSAAAASHAAPDEARALLLGVGAGALVAAIALGVVLTYRGSGVVNFASGAVAMYAAYVYDALRRSGELFLPPLPRGASFGAPLDFLPGAARHARARDAARARLSTCSSSARCAHAPPLAKVVASVGAADRAAGARRPALRQRRRGPCSRCSPRRRCGCPATSRSRSDQLVLAGIVVLVAARAVGAVPLHPLRPRDARRGREREAARSCSASRRTCWPARTGCSRRCSPALLGMLVATVNGVDRPDRRSRCSSSRRSPPRCSAASARSASRPPPALGIAMVQNLIQYLCDEVVVPARGRRRRCPASRRRCRSS